MPGSSSPKGIHLPSHSGSFHQESTTRAGGDFPKAVLASGDAHRELMTQFLANRAVRTGFVRLLLEMLGKSA